MSLLDSGRPPRDILPPINRPDFETSRLEKNDPPRFSIMPGLSISTAPLASPTTIYAGPPPPYSCASSTTESTHGYSGYFSPPLTSSRRLTRDEKDLLSAKTLPSLPSLHEALGGDKSTPLPVPQSTTQSIASGSISTTAIGQHFSESTRGPPNPFAHTTAPPLPGSSYTQAESVSSKPATTVNTAPDPGHHAPRPYSTSPHTKNTHHRSSAGSFSSTTRPFESTSNNAPFSSQSSVHHTQFRDYSSQQAPPPPPPPTQSQPSNTFNFEPNVKFDESRNPFARSNPPASYGETVKRHLDVFDAELALNEITEVSMRTADFSRAWAQRYHQSNRTSYFADSAPSIQEIDEMMRQQHRVMENLNRIREVVVLQQTALTEQRARAARGHFDDDYHGMHEEYKSGGFAGGDAKKRRGKAAPPGRCHSCQRAETPEWRRGPDGARTLCNACGLHYAKLTRKLGAGKASTLTGSNLRPKGLDPRISHI